MTPILMAFAAGMNFAIGVVWMVTGTHPVGIGISLSAVGLFLGFVALKVRKR